MTSLRIFFIGGVTAYRGLINWLSPWIFIPTLVVAPIFQILLFVSRRRSPSAAHTSPSPVQENVATAITMPIGSHVETGMSIPRISADTASENAATRIAFTITGTARPR